MSTLDGRYDALHARQFVAAIDSLVVVDAEHLRTSLLSHVAVHGSHARIVESGRDGEGFLYLSVLILHHEHLRPVQDACRTLMDGGCRVVCLPSVSASLRQHDLYALVVHVVVDGARRIRAAADAGDEIVGIVAAYLLLQLPFDLLRDHALHTGHEVRVGVWPHRRTYDVEGVGRMAAPVADGLTAGIAQRHVTCAYGVHLCAQHLHALHVCVLTLHIGSSHEYLALHVHQCTDRRRCHTVLSSTRLRDDARLAHFLGKQNLSDGVVDLVGTCVVQVLTLQVELAAVLLTHALGIIER